jgi:hypothetical protein
MDTSASFFKDLTTVETDQKQLESIDRLQQAFLDVRKSYSQEYKESLNHLLTNVKDKMKRNPGMVDAVNTYVSKFVPVNKQDVAKEELYNLLAAEMLQTLQTLQHATCLVM